MHEHTADAVRSTVRDYCRDILRVTDAMEPTLAEIQEIESTAQALILAARKWRSSEALVMASESAKRRAFLDHVGIQSEPRPLMTERWL